MIVAAEQLTLGVTEVLVYCGLVAFAIMTVKVFPEAWHRERRHLEATPDWLGGRALAGLHPRGAPERGG